MFPLISMAVLTVIALMLFRVLTRATEMAAQKAAKHQAEDGELEEVTKGGGSTGHQPVNRLKKYGL